LQSQLKSLGLTGTFLDEDSDDEELAAASDWTDESESSPLPKLTQKQAPPKAVGLQPRTIDRPVQLSIPAKPESRKPGLQKHHQLKLEPHSLWYAIERPPGQATSTIPNAEIISHLHARGKVLLQTESDNYINSNHITSADRQFLSTIMTSGTQTDKLSALTLSISSSPLHCTKQLDALLGMAKKKSRNEAVQAVAALKDLLIGNLLPDRKLIYFGKQVGLSSHAKDEELILWTFEDWLKGWYFQVLQVIEVYPVRQDC
jgi:ribosome biogenesis protein MAK21